MTKKYRQHWKTRQSALADHGKTSSRNEVLIPVTVDAATRIAAVKAAVQHKHSEPTTGRITP